MNTVIISDTSCLIALDRINKLEILNQLFAVIITTPDVQSEFKKELPAWIHLQNVKDIDKFNELKNLVDLGEASAIALAIETDSSVLIIDEKKGRQVARNFNIPIIGTLKIILLAKKKGIIPLIKPVIEELELNKFRFSKSLITQTLIEGEEI